MEKIKKIIKDKDLHFALIASFILGMLAHGYAFFNIIFSHDSLIMFQNDTEYQISLGRFLHWFIFEFRGNYYVPWLVGFIGIAFIAFTAYLIFKIFNIKENWQKILIVAVLCVNRAVIKTIEVYMHDFDIYMIALFFSTLGAYILIKNNGNFLKQSLSVIPFFISLGLYPAYIQVGIGILMIYIILDLLKNKEKLAVILKRGFTYIFFLLIGLILYFIGTKLSIKVFNIDISNKYNSVGNIKNINNLNVILHSLKLTYTGLASFYFKINVFNKKVMFFLNMILGISGIYFVIKLIRENKLNIRSVLTLILVFALLPFGLNLSCFLSGGISHMLMRYSMTLLYILYILLIDMYSGNIRKNESNKNIIKSFKTLALILSCFVIFNNIVDANQKYYKKELAFRHSNNVFNRMIIKLEEIEDYEPGKTPVYLIHESLMDNKEKYGELSVTYKDTYKWFLQFVMQYNINLNINENKDLTKEDLEYIKTMSIYPKKDSVKYNNGKVFIKFGE